jgi:peptidoglycan L-alanyl-D-glutamate endopeptidase CwlK
MPFFSKASQEKLKTCHPDLIRLFERIILYFDCTVICGYRNKEDQEKAFLSGHSKVKFPYSEHNKTPSMAVDVIPFPVDWNDTKQMYYFAGYVKATANEMGIKLRVGADWNGNMQIKDENFADLPHFELVD